MSKEDEVKEIAHRLWVESGKPDGDVLVEYYGKLIKLKELHWEKAEAEWTYGLEHLESRSF